MRLLDARVALSIALSSLPVIGGAATPAGSPKVWLKGEAGVITDSSGNVQRWEDQSGNGNHLEQPDSTKRPAQIAEAFIIGEGELNKLPLIQDGNSTHGGTLGMDFVVDEPVTINQLAAFDHLRDGFTNTITIQIWERNDGGTVNTPQDDTPGVIREQLTFTSAAPGTLQGSYRWKTLATPLVLAPGSYTIVSSGYTGQDAYFSSGNNSGGPKTPGIRRVGESRYSNGAGWPEIVPGTYNDYYAGAMNLRFQRNSTTRVARPGLQFDGNNDGLLAVSTLNLSRPSSVFIVYERDSRDSGYVIQNSTGAHWFIRDDGYYANGWIRNGAVPWAPSQVATMVNSAGFTHAYQGYNDVTADPNPVAGNPQRLALGGGEGNGNDPLAVRIAEVLAYDRELSASEIWETQTYLGEKYGVYASQTQTPEISPVGSPGTGNVSVTMADGTVGSVIRYTTDGSDPTASSSVYTAALNVARGTEVRARAFFGSNPASGVASQFYAIATGELPVGGALMWLRGDRALEKDSDGKIVRWRDLTGNGNDMVQTTQSQRPKLVQSFQQNGGVAILPLNPASENGIYNHNGTLGADFVASEPIEISELGAYDFRMDGFGSAVKVQIWSRNDHGTPNTPEDDTAGSLLAEAEFTSAAPGTLDGSTRYKAITPVTLPVGSYSILATGFTGANFYQNNASATWQEDGIKFVNRSRYTSSLTDWPTNLDSSPAQYNGAGNFRFKKVSSVAAVKSSVEFDGIDDGMWAVPGSNFPRSNPGDETTVYVVFEKMGAGVILQNSAPPWWFLRDDGGYSGNWVRNRSFPSNTPVIAAMSNGLVQTHLYVNGEDWTTDPNPGVAALGRLALGGGNGYSYYPGRNRIAELIVFPGELSASQRWQVENYLGQRYRKTSEREPLPAVAISPAGSYGTGAITVTLTQSVTGADIRYTTDGTDPIATSPVYGSPISVTRGHEVRARAFLTGAVPGLVSKEFYGQAGAADELPVAGAKLWVRGDSGVELDEAGRVSRWHDLTGNGNDLLQGTADQRPALSADGFAGTSLSAITVPDGDGNSTYPGSLGEDFVVDQAVSVTQLGAFDHRKDGFSGTIHVQLWSRNDHGTPNTPGDDTPGTLLAEQTFDSAAPGTLEGVIRFKNLATPVALTPGSYTIYAWGYESTNLYYEGVRGAAGGDPRFHFVGVSRYISTGGGAWPTSLDSRSLDYNGAANFKIAAAAGSATIQPTVVFDGNDDALTGVSTMNFGRPSTVLIAFQYDRSESGVLLQNMSSNWWFIRNDGYYANGFIRNDSFETQKPYLAVMTNATDGTRAYRNGEDVTIDPSMTGANPGRLALGGGAGIGIDAAPVRVAEMIVYDRVLTPAELFTAQSYLAKRHQIFSPTTETPVISPASGYGTGAVAVTISTSTPGAVIRYTTDGSEPTETSPIYTVGISVPRGSTVKARAFSPGAPASGRTESFYGESSSNPLPVTDAALWIRADNGVETNANGTVSRWKDLSGHGRDILQPLSDRQPKVIDGGFGGAIKTALVTPPNAPGDNTYSGWLGTDFLVTENVDITHLGAFDRYGDGFTGTITVRLHRVDEHGTPTVYSDDTSDAILTTMTFTHALPGELSGSTRYLPLATPLSLPPGHYFIESSGWVGADTYYDPPAWAEATGDGVTFFNSSRYSTGGTFPGTLVGDNRYLSASGFKFRKSGAVNPSFRSVRFDGVNDGMLGPADYLVGRPSTVFLVFNQLSSSQGRLLQSGNGRNWLLGPHTSPQGFYAEGWVAQTSIRSNARSLSVAVQDVNDSRYFYNGSDLTQDPNPTGTLGRIALGGGEGTYFQPTNADLVELIVYDRVLSPAERQQVSSALSARYELPLESLIPPVASPDGGLFSGSQTVSLSHRLSGTVIRYTTDGSEPTESSAIYASPFIVSSSVTVKAKAFRAGYLASGVQESSFVIDASTPVIPQRQAMQLWLRAGVGTVADSNGVSAWHDLSGKGADAAQVTSDARPVLSPTAIGGSPALIFDGTNDFLKLPEGFKDFSQGLTAMFVVRSDGGGAWQHMLDIGRGQGLSNIVFGRSGSTTAFYYDVYNGSLRDLIAPEVLLPSANVIVTVSQLPDGSAKVFANGSLISEAPAGFPIANNILRTSNLIGKSNFGGDAFFSGAISEIVFYNTALGDFERETLENSIRTHYGIATSATGTVAFSPSPAVLYPSGTNVTLASVTADAHIHYTLDGSVPTESSPLYSAPIPISGSTRIRARAFADGFNASQFSEATYLIGQPPSSGDGLLGTYFDNEDFTGSSLTRVDPQINFDWSSVAPDPAIGHDYFSVRWTGKLVPRFSENYVFHLAADDGQRLWIDLNHNGIFEDATELIVNDWTIKGETERSSVAVPLVAGQLYDIKVEYFQAYSSSSVRLRWSSFSEPKDFIPQSQLFSNAAFSQTVTTPVIAPGSGTYTAAVDSTISTATAGATIYYTTDGSEPTTSSQVYGGVFQIGATGQVKAKAYKAGFNPSGVATVSYQIDAQPPVIGSFAWNGTSIANGETFTRKGVFSATATDNQGIASAEFYYEPSGTGSRILVGRDTYVPDGLSAEWNIAPISDGPYNVIVRVFDTSGAYSETSRSVNLTLAVPIAPQITSPASGVSVQDASVTLQIQAEPSVNVRVYRDGVFIFSGYSPAGNGSFNYTAPLPNGASTFKAVAQNRAGPSADSNLVTVTRVREFPQLSLSFGAENTVIEGTPLIGTVSIPAAEVNDLIVQVSTNKASQFEALPVVVIPAGSTTATFSLIARQDTLIELLSTVQVSAAAVEHRSDAKDIFLADDDAPAITLELDRVTISESEGAMVATIRREAATDRAVRVDLTNDLPARLNVPEFVEIAAGEKSKTFSISAIDDALDNGNQLAHLRGKVSVSGTVISQTPIVELEIRDDEGPLLTLELGKPLINEGTSLSGIIRRAGASNTAPLLVSLSSQPSGQLTLPALVTIPAGQDTAPFTITAPNDPATSGTRSIAVRASAEAYTDALATINLTDKALPDLVPTNLTAPATAPTEQYTPVSYQVHNYGSMPAGNYIERIYLSRDLSAGADDLLVRQIDSSGEVAAGGSYGRSVTVLTPRETGTYYLIVTLDGPNDVPEVDETNNTAILIQPIVVKAAYDVTVHTDSEIVPTNTPIVFSGTANKEGGLPAQFSMVNIHIGLNGTDRVISAVTNSLGQFTTTWTPLRNEGGLYTVGASHPGSPTAPTQDSFEILTLGFDPPPSVAMNEGETKVVQATLRNPNLRPLTGLNITLAGIPAGLTITPQIPAGAASLAAGGELVVPISITASAGFSGGGTVQLTATSSEGITMRAEIGVHVELLKPVLTVDPLSLNFSVLRGTSKSSSFTITNTGGLATGPVQVLLPDLPWLTLVSANPVPSLAPGQSASVSVALAPGNTVPLTQFSGSLALNPATGEGKAFPYVFRVVSDLRGDLSIEVDDELTFFTAEAPKLQGARVTVRDAISSEQIATLDTNADGLANFTGLPEGWYRVEVSAVDHDSFGGNYFVNAGQANPQQVFISKHLVKYSWKVEEVEIQDVYKVTLETTFETNVPAPVVTVSPGEIDVGDLIALGQTKTVNMTLENHGLIAAQHGMFRFSDHPFYQFTPLVTNIGTIPAKSSLVVPVTITRIGIFDDDGNVITLRNGKRAINSRATTPVPCGAGGSVDYDYPCGQHNIQKAANFIISKVQGYCGGGSGPGGGGGGYTGFLLNFYGGGNGLGVSVTPRSDGGVSLSSPDPCTPDCLAKAALDCAIGFTPLGCAYSGAGCVLTGDGCLSALEGCIADLTPFGALNNAGQCILAFMDCHGAGGAGGGGGGGGPGPNNSRDVSSDYYLGTAQKAFSPEVGESWVRAQTVLKYLEKIYSSRALVLAIGTTDGRAVMSQFGAFINESSDGGATIIESEAAVLEAYAASKQIDVAEMQKAIARWNRTVDYYARGIHEISQVPPGESTDFMDKAGMATVAEPLIAAFNTSRALGFADPFEELLSDYAVLRQDLEGEQGGACAKVKIQISQDVMMTRTAFQATLELENEREDLVTDVGFSLSVKDSGGLPADDLFNIQVSKLTGLGAIDGTGEIASKAKGTVQWTLIPRDTAALEAATLYTIGGVIHYTQNGTVFNIPVENVPITVRPDASLELKYFHQRDVISDDPHTDAIEPAQPYKLAVMVENKGFGDARNLKIISGQPTIVDNEKGLLVDFKIIGTEVDGTPLSPSLTADFGTVAPGQRKIATWLMTSTLQGLFTDYKATFEHTTGLGDPRISLLKSVEIHEMIRMIRAQGPGEDSAPDFLVNDVADANDYPDTIHYSDGGTDLVTVKQTGTFTGTLSPSNLSINLNVGAFTGWSYIRLPDPGAGNYVLVSATRSDGRVLPLDFNVWQSDRTFIGGGRQPRNERIIHLADDNSSGSYTLVYALAAPLDMVAPVSAVTALPAHSFADIPVFWSGTDNGGIAFYDVYVSVNGGGFALWRSKTQEIGGVYQGVVNSTYSFYAIATDSAGNVEQKSPLVEASTTVTLANLAPVITDIDNQSIDEGGIFQYQAAARDPDGPAGDIRFSIAANQPGFTIDAITGVIRWTTGEADGGKTASVVVIAKDSGVPQGVSNELFTVTVVDVNSPPVISKVGPQTLAAGSVLLVDVDATDGDIPAQTVTFSLADEPPGATINGTTGLISWVPTNEQAGKNFVFIVRATDSGSPAQFAETSFAASVTGAEDHPPAFTSVPVVLWTKGQSYSLNVVATDADGDPITLTANLSEAAGAAFADHGNGSGTLNWNLATVDAGVYHVPVAATANGKSVNAIVSIRVANNDLYWNWVKNAFGSSLPNGFDLSLLEMDADYDGDGIGNVHEMAFMTNPLVKDSPKVSVKIDLQPPFSVIQIGTKRRKGSQAFVDLGLQRNGSLLGAWEPVPPSDWGAAIDPNGDADNDPESEEVEFSLYEYHPEGIPNHFFYRIDSSRK